MALQWTSVSFYSWIYELNKSPLEPHSRKCVLHCVLNNYFMNIYLNMYIYICANLQAVTSGKCTWWNRTNIDTLSTVYTVDAKGAVNASDGECSALKIASYTIRTGQNWEENIFSCHISEVEHKRTANRRDTENLPSSGEREKPQTVSRIMITIIGQLLKKCKYSKYTLFKNTQILNAGVHSLINIFI